MALSRLNGIGDKRRADLLDAFGSATEALNVPTSQWAPVLGLRVAVLEKTRSTLDRSWAQSRLATLEAGEGGPFCFRTVVIPNCYGSWRLPRPCCSSSELLLCSNRHAA